MIRFINLTEQYYCFDKIEVQGDVLAVFAFINTVNNRFLESDDNSHVFYSREDVSLAFHGTTTKDRLLSLIPKEIK